MLKKIEKEFKHRLDIIYTRDESSVLFKMIISFLIRDNINNIVNKELSESQLINFDQFTTQLLAHQPIQYVLGEADFYHIKFKVNRDVLIPRPETEELVYLIICEQSNKEVTVLDIGTGSGCIPIALKKNLPLAQICAIDISESALVLANENAILNKAEVIFSKADALNLVSSEWSQFDVIVSNPPYIAQSEMEMMEENVKSHEPHLALFVDDDEPLIFYDKIGDFALSNLKLGGTLYFEINQQLAKETADILMKKGFTTTIIKDINQNDRILKAQLLG
ncbi:MAG: peptide chain release factor N(5)-glutamine methyltransferase [Bacteroidetes bacterium]|nr:peptide chain release factor N(5)-glutamine methyltransferase [Bacteroidota bacterium]MBU1371619.1 peptide chain release factor N(5)-glutamine methyltransferase [Bacteroidota bacterium]MBU1486195.1 peptide chain release factor N(5)-glutamine methyltransferase [Bacteroidota bacterium]MBU1761966.1 peptide chain release factor N(5)-glutamine methyltransferase [Bacteroidota bacterium]MBU2269455.1 peptide chain release factor N(5)-glutamine methyltransferase [Bacteroidota bacterium]